MKEYHWWILSFLAAAAIASTEVYICGWHGEVYECVTPDDSESSPPEIWIQPQDEDLVTLPCIESPPGTCLDI